MRKVGGWFSFHPYSISINPPIPPSTRPQVNASSLLAKVSLGRPPVVVQALKARNALNKTAGTSVFSENPQLT